jgi:glucose-1-phosphate thymidylyltransferase
MRLAGVTHAYIVIRKGKWDIPAYFGDGLILDMQLAYLMMGLPFGVPYTIDQAYPFVRDTIVAFGFPDIIFEDVVVGIFPADRPQKVDMVDLRDDGRIERLVIKPQETKFRYTWGIAVWTSVFTHFMHEYLAAIAEKAARQSELFVGDVFNEAIQEGLKVEGMLVSDKPFLDIGTGDDLLRAVKNYGARVE